MLIDDIDFADLYLQQLKLAHRTEKTPDHWDRTGGKNGGKLRLAYGQLPATTDR